jgi:HEAT repeat protein
MTSPELAGLLEALFDAERAVREAHRRLTAGAPGEVVRLLDAAARAAEKLDGDERSRRLVRVSEVLGEMAGPQVVDLLIDILASDDAEARRAAGEALSERAWDRFKDVALGIERALDRLPANSPALLELPYILAEVPEPGALKLLGDFLKHPAAEVVAAAIEALVQRVDPKALELIEPLANDKRRVEIEDDEGMSGEATIGELVAEARTMWEEN